MCFNQTGDISTLNGSPYYIFLCFGRGTSVARRDHGGGWALSKSCRGYCRSLYDAEITRNRQWRQRITEDLPDATKMNDWNSPLKLVDKLIYLQSSVSSSETDINIQLAKAWTAMDRLPVIWKSDLTDKIKRSFFPSSSHVDTAIWMQYMDANWTYRETAWWQLHKNIDGGSTPQSSSCTATYHPSRKVRQTRHVGHCWRSGDEHVSDIFPWTPSHVRAKAGWPAKIHVQQLCADTGCSLEDLPEAMDDREECWERFKEIPAGGATWWWWWWWYNAFVQLTILNFQP